MQLQRNGNSLLVPMSAGNGGPNTVNVTLILDTGANLTVIPSRVAKALGLVKVRDLTLHTAGGEARAYMARLPELSLQQFKVRDLQVAVHDIPNLGPSEGLLGVDFLGNFKMSLDTQSGALTLDKK